MRHFDLNRFLEKIRSRTGQQGAADKEQKFQQSLRSFTKENDTHGRYTSELGACTQTLSHCSLIIESEAERGFELVEMSTFCERHLRSLDELVHTAVSCLEHKTYLAAETLARTAFEQAGTLVYVLGDHHGERLHSMLRRYLDTVSFQAAQWQLNAYKREDPNDARLAKNRHESVDLIRRACGYPWRDAGQWPLPNDRIDATFLAPQYYYLTAGAVTMEHSLAEYVVFDMICNNLPETIRADSRRAMISEKHSLVVFLVAYAAWFQCHVLLWLAEAGKNTQVMEDMKSISTTLVRIIDELEASTTSFRASFFPEK